MYPEDRLYNIQNSTYYFHTGCLTDGHQVLMGVQMPEAVLLLFDASGNYECTHVRDFSTLPSTDFSQGFYAQEGISHISEKEIPAWQEEIGYVPGTIRVKRFFLPERWIGIREIPEDYEEEAINADFPDEEAEEMREVRRRWYADQSFVLCFDEDYYMSEDGDVDSS